MLLKHSVIYCSKSPNTSWQLSPSSSSNTFSVKIKLRNVCVNGDAFILVSITLGAVSVQPLSKQSESSNGYLCSSCSWSFVKSTLMDFTDASQISSLSMMCEIRTIFMPSKFQTTLTVQWPQAKFGRTYMASIMDSQSKNQWLSLSFIKLVMEEWGKGTVNIPSGPVIPSVIYSTWALIVCFWHLSVFAISSFDSSVLNGSMSWWSLHKCMLLHSFTSLS